MFFSSDRLAWTPLTSRNTNDQMHERHKRHFQNNSESKKKSAYNTDSRSDSRVEPDYENAPLQEIFNFTTSSERESRITQNAIATTADPLEEILRSINVFPVDADPDVSKTVVSLELKSTRHDDGEKKECKSKALTHEAIRRNASAPRVSGNDSVVGEHSRLGRSLKSVATGM